MTPRKKNRDVAIVDQANIDTDYKNGGIDPAHTDLGSTTPPEREADVMANTVESMMQAVGASGTKMFGGRLYEEYNPKLTGLNGLTLYDEMRRSDAQVHACLLALELPIRSTMWYIEPGSTINAEGEAEVTDSDRQIKEFLEKALFEQMETTFDDLLRQILSMCTFWFSVFEKVYKQIDDKIVLKALYQRLARTVWTWDRDKETGKYGITQQLLMNDEGKPLVVKLSHDQIVIFTFRREGDNMEGISVLRSAYKHWYIKDTLYKLDAVKHERQSVGIPIITLPETHSDADGKEAENILGSLRSTEKTYIVLPSPQWKFEFAQMGGGTVLDTANSIEHHNKEIVKNILAGFLDLGSSKGGGGSYALSEDQSSLFLLSLSAVAQQIQDTLNNEVVKDLVDLNFTLAPNQQYPKLAFQKLGEVKYDELASSLSTLSGAGLITPDQGTEDYIRKLYDLPKKAEDAEDPEEENELEEDEETEGLEEAANEEADAETQEEVDSPEADDAEMQKLEDEMSKLEASEVERFSEDALEYSDEIVDSMIFAMSPDDATREKIRQGLIAYWDRKGRKAKPTMSQRKDNFDKNAKNAGGKIKDAVDKYKSTVAPLKQAIESLKAQNKAGKLSSKQLKAKTKEIRSQIKAIRDSKNEHVQTLRFIKRDALQGKKQVKATISARKKAISGVIKQITADVTAKNSTRSEAIKSLATQIKANVQNYTQLKASAKTKEEKQGLKSMYAQIKSENDSLRSTAKQIRGDAKNERTQAKAKKDELKKSVASMSEIFSESTPWYSGCVMLNVDPSLFENFPINPEDLEDSWYEIDPPHVTLLYGIGDEVSLSDIKAKIRYNGQSPKIKGMKIFEGETNDVLVCEVEKEEWITSLNRSLRQLDYQNSFPDYTPHITLAYCKKWQASKYLSDVFNGKIVAGRDIVYTSSVDSVPTTLIGETDRQMSEEEILAHNFSDKDEMTSFLQARKFFDPQVLIRVQNYGA